MLVLRIGTSNDEDGGVPREQRSWCVAERLLAEVTGEPVETVLKRGWPNDSYPSMVTRWVKEYEPDMVVLQVNNFWYGHESVALWVERRFGKAGKRVNAAGARVARSKTMFVQRLSLIANRWLGRVVPAATPFSVAQVAATMEGAIRAAVSDEGRIVIVRGHENWAEIPYAGKRANRRNLARNAQMSAAMRAVCERLHVPYYERGLTPAAEMGLILDGARWHNSAEGERRIGEFDGAAMAEAWEAAKILA